MNSLALKGITKNFGQVTVVKDVDLEVKDGEFVVLVGPSGCGKSTLLRMIAGLEDSSDGALFIDDEDVTEVTAASRPIAMVFQSYALYPHMNVAENLSFGLKNMKVARPEIEAQVKKAADILQLSDYLDRKPKNLSGGQRQRVAMGRAIVRDPQVFLFDEPLSNLDAELRVQMRHELIRLHRQLGSTMIYVTHDQVEAMTMADRIVVLQGGKIEQVGTPLELYNTPNNIFVAGFIGSPKINLFDASVSNVKSKSVGLVLDDGQEIQISGNLPTLKPDEKIQIGVRPEHLEIGNGGEGFAIEAEVETVEVLGDVSFIYALKGAQDIRLKLAGQHKFDPQQRLSLNARTENLLLFKSNGQAIRA
jgi:ABC-type sugar transport system ATPase subunit